MLTPRNQRTQQRRYGFGNLFAEVCQVGPGVIDSGGTAGREVTKRQDSLPIGARPSDEEIGFCLRTDHETLGRADQIRVLLDVRACADGHVVASATNTVQLGGIRFAGAGSQAGYVDPDPLGPAVLLDALIQKPGHR